jgi:hypothetical protein
MNKSIWRCWNGGTNQATLEIDNPGSRSRRERKTHKNKQTQNGKEQHTTESLCSRRHEARKWAPRSWWNGTASSLLLCVRTQGQTQGHSVSLLSLVNAQRRETMKQGNPKMPRSVLKSRVRLFYGNPKLPNLRYVHTKW